MKRKAETQIENKASCRKARLDATASSNDSCVETLLRVLLSPGLESIVLAYLMDQNPFQLFVDPYPALQHNPVWYATQCRFANREQLLQTYEMTGKDQRAAAIGMRENLVRHLCDEALSKHITARDMWWVFQSHYPLEQQLAFISKHIRRPCISHLCMFVDFKRTEYWALNCPEVDAFFTTKFSRLLNDEAIRIFSNFISKSKFVDEARSCEMAGRRSIWDHPFFEVFNALCFDLEDSVRTRSWVLAYYRPDEKHAHLNELIQPVSPGGKGYIINTIARLELLLGDHKYAQHLRDLKSLRDKAVMEDRYQDVAGLTNPRHALEAIAQDCDEFFKGRSLPDMIFPERNLTEDVMNVSKRSFFLTRCTEYLLACNPRSATAWHLVGAQNGDVDLLERIALQ